MQDENPEKQKAEDAQVEEKESEKDVGNRVRVLYVPADPDTNRAVIDELSSLSDSSDTFIIEPYRTQRCLITHQSRPSFLISSVHLVSLETSENVVSAP